MATVQLSLSPIRLKGFAPSNSVQVQYFVLRTVSKLPGELLDYFPILGELGPLEFALQGDAAGDSYGETNASKAALC